MHPAESPMSGQGRPKPHGTTIAVILVVQLAVKLITYSDTVTPFPGVMAYIATTMSNHPWTLLLPSGFEPGRIYWATTGLVPYSLLIRLLGALPAFLLINAAGTVIAYVCAWRISKSWGTATTWALMMAIGTHLTYGFVIPNINSAYLYLSYLQLTLCTAFLLISGRGQPKRLRKWFLVWLVVLALCWEQWLNVAVALLLCGTGLLVWNRQHKKLRHDGITFVMLTTAAVFIIYVLIRTSYADEYVRPGTEEELIIAYPVSLWRLATEDFISNFFTYTYLSFDSWLPSFLISSNSLVAYGRDAIIAAQNGYHQEFQHLTGYHHIFYWRYYAGVVMALFVLFFYNRLRAAFASGEAAALVPVAICVLIAVGSSVHLLIKYRPYLSTPALHYKATLGVLGAGMLFVWLLQEAREHVRPTRYPLLVFAVWGLLIVNSVTRPAVQAVLLSEVGLLGRGTPFANLEWRALVPFGPALKRLLPDVERHLPR